MSPGSASNWAGLASFCNLLKNNICYFDSIKCQCFYFFVIKYVYKKYPNLTRKLMQLYDHVQFPGHELPSKKLRRARLETMRQLPTYARHT